ncbi:MAG: ABC transporter substrate-binding protein [Thermomicrobiales bacterium]
MTDVHDKNLTRRGFLAGIAAAAGSAILAACGGSSSPTATTAATVAATKPAAAASPTASAAASAASPAAAAPTTAAASSAVSPTSAAASAPAAAGTAAPAASGGSTVITAPTAAASTGTTGGQVNVKWVKPATIHPLFSTAGIEQGAERQMFGALVRINDKLEPLPDLAQTIETSADAKTYTFTLKKGLTFSDGKPLTSADVIFTIERAVDKRTGSYWRGRLLAIDGAADFGDQKTTTIKGLEAPDANTVKMTLTVPDSTWLITIGDFAGLSILPKHILESTPPDQMAKSPFAFAPTPSGGAFTFADWKADQYLQVKRNETYAAGPKAKLDSIFFKVITQDDAGLAQLESGEMDLFAAVPVSEVDRLRKNANLTVVSVPSPSVTFLAFNFGRDTPFKDKRVRQAMMYAIDRAGIVKQVLNGEGTVVNSTIIGPDWMGIPEGLNQYAFDPNKAKQLLKDANFNSSAKFSLIYIPGTKITDAWLPIAQQQLKDVGINVDLTQLDGTEYTKRVVTGATPTTTGDFDIAEVDGGVFRADPNVSAKYFETTSFVPAGGNYGHYTNPQVDDLLKQGRATPDKAQRKTIYTNLAKVLNDDCPWVFLWSPNSIHAYNKRLQGFKPPSYANSFMWNAEEWSVTK